MYSVMMYVLQDKVDVLCHVVLQDKVDVLCHDVCIAGQG